MSEFFKELFNITGDQLDANAIHEGVVAGVRLKGAPLIILFCAIIIASVGLNTNSTAVIIGAMLISPLMNPIIAIGYSLATYDSRLLRNSALNFVIQIVIALIGATLFFTLTPIHTPSSELIARTGPSYFDMLIAFFGGTAGVIGITRSERTNVIPGVAIATALMPPLCTVGYGIANSQSNFILGASYLFVINAFFIMLATFTFCKLLKLKQADVVKEYFNKLVKRGIILGITLIIIPATISAVVVSVQDYSKNRLFDQIESFVDTEVDSSSTTTMQVTVDPQNKKLDLDLVGDVYTEEELNLIRSRLPDYGLSGYSVEFVQDIRTILFSYFEKVNQSGFSKQSIVLATD